jgi:hypothetical protein
LNGRLSACYTFPALAAGALSRLEKVSERIANMEYHTVAVRIDNGVVRSIDGSPLPEQAYALLVIMPRRVEGETPTEWQQAFDAFFEQVRRNPPPEDLEQVSDRELNAIVHSARHS